MLINDALLDLAGQSGQIPVTQAELYLLGVPLGPLDFRPERPERVLAVDRDGALLLASARSGAVEQLLARSGLRPPPAPRPRAPPPGQLLLPFMRA